MTSHVLDRADVVIVGAGTVGISTAFFLAEKGLDVVVLEREQVAWGASGRNAGFMWIHLRTPGIALDMSRAGIRIVEELAPELGQSIGLQRNGGIIYFQTDAQRRVMAEFVASRNADGVPTQLLDAQQARELAPMLPDDAIGATYCPEDGQIRSPEFVRRLAALTEAKGVRIREGVTALSLVRAAGGVAGVRTTDGVVLADRVVWATGAWSGELEREGLSVPVRPTRIGVLLTERVPAKLNVVMYGPGGAKQYSVIRDQPSFRVEDFLGPWEDPAGGFEYNELIAQRPDGRLQIGNPEDTHAGFDQRVPIWGMKMMIDAFLARWPHLRGLAIDGIWSGLIPVTPDALPIIDRIDEIPGLFFCAGHVYGNTAGPVSGKLTAELVNGEQPSMAIDELAFDRPALLRGFDDGAAGAEPTEMVRWA